MKRRDLDKFLRSLGAKFEEGGKHSKVYLNGKQTGEWKIYDELGNILKTEKY